jgi:hypothetical protein
MTEWKPETADEIISNIQSHVKDILSQRMSNQLPKWLMNKNEYELLLKIEKEMKETAKRPTKEK